MTIAELLTSQRRWGRTRARKFLLPLSLNENKQLGTLTSRQRRAARHRARRPRRRRPRGASDRSRRPSSAAHPPTR